MSSLEEVTNQLMKPVKELADWEYPLSEVRFLKPFTYKKLKFLFVYN